MYIKRLKEKNNNLKIEGKNKEFKYKKTKKNKNCVVEVNGICYPYSTPYWDLVHSMTI